MATELTNIGDQQITFDFKNAIKGSEFNKLLYGILPQGIYSGGALSNVGNTITVAPFTAVFESNSENATVITTTQNAEISSIDGGLGDITDATPYVIMNYQYLEQIENWINFEFKATPLATDIVVGIVTFDGGGLVTGFDYSETNYGIQLDSIGKLVTTVLDEDDFASDSDTSLATQQSIKAYADNKILDEDDMASDSTNQAPSQQSIKAFILNYIYPIGTTYIQFPGDSDPSALFGGTWSNVSSELAGDFIRFEGGRASSFNSGQQSDAMQRIIATVDYRALYNGVSILNNSSSAFSRSNSSSADSIGVNSSAVDKSVTRLTFDNSNSDNPQDAKTDNYETRSVNRTVRKWRRTA